MNGSSREWDREKDEDSVAKSATVQPPAPSVTPGSLQWASAVGNQAVQRLARTTVAREAVAEEEEEAEGGEAAPAAEAAAGGAGSAGAQEEAPEDELPE